MMNTNWSLLFANHCYYVVRIKFIIVVFTFFFRKINICIKYLFNIL